MPSLWTVAVCSAKANASLEAKVWTRVGKKGWSPTTAVAFRKCTPLHLHTLRTVKASKLSNGETPCMASVWTRRPLANDTQLVDAVAKVITECKKANFGIANTIEHDLKQFETLLSKAHDVQLAWLKDVNGSELARVKQYLSSSDKDAKPKLQSYIDKIFKSTWNIKRQCQCMSLSFFRTSSKASPISLMKMTNQIRVQYIIVFIHVDFRHQQIIDLEIWYVYQVCRRRRWTEGVLWLSVVTSSDSFTTSCTSTNLCTFHALAYKNYHKTKAIYSDSIWQGKTLKHAFQIHVSWCMLNITMACLSSWWFKGLARLHHPSHWHIPRPSTFLLLANISASGHKQYSDFVDVTREKQGKISFKTLRFDNPGVFSWMTLVWTNCDEDKNWIICKRRLRYAPTRNTLTKCPSCRTLASMPTRIR